MVVSVAGIVINVLMVIVIITILVIGWNFSNQRVICETQQSPFCYTIQCPCDSPSQGPCLGYAKQPVGPNRWICSSAPLTVVNDSGAIV